jgi:hypothetical protein
MGTTARPRFLIPLAADSLVRAETAIEELWATDQGAAS